MTPSIQERGREKPIVYLDIDDTLICYPHDKDKLWWQAHPNGMPMNGVERILREMREHCEVRWLTMWAIGGSLGDEGEQRLAGVLGVPIALVQGCDNPIGWGRVGGSRKTNGVDWAAHHAKRPWVWIEDALLDDERTELKQRGVFDRYFECNAGDPAALALAWHFAKLVLGISAAPPSQVGGE